MTTPHCPYGHMPTPNPICRADGSAPSPLQPSLSSTWRNAGRNAKWPPAGCCGVKTKEAASPNPTVPVPACQQVIGSGHTGRDAVAVGPASRPAQTGEQGQRILLRLGCPLRWWGPYLTMKNGRQWPKPVSRCPLGWSRSSPGYSL